MQIIKCTFFSTPPTVDPVAGGIRKFWIMTALAIVLILVAVVLVVIYGNYIDSNNSSSGPVNCTGNPLYDIEAFVNTHTMTANCPTNTKGELIFEYAHGSSCVFSCKCFSWGCRSMHVWERGSDGEIISEKKATFSVQFTCHNGSWKWSRTSYNR